MRTGDENFELFGPVSLDWDEYRSKLAIVPASRADFHAHLVKHRATPALAQGLLGLGVLDARRDQTLLATIDAVSRGEALPEVETGGLTEAQIASLPLRERVMHVVDTVVAPILRNDGGKVEILGVDA